MGEQYLDDFGRDTRRIFQAFMSGVLDNYVILGVYIEAMGVALTEASDERAEQIKELRESTAEQYRGRYGTEVPIDLLLRAHLLTKTGKVRTIEVAFPISLLVNMSDDALDRVVSTFVEDTDSQTNGELVRITDELAA